MDAMVTGLMQQSMTNTTPAYMVDSQSPRDQSVSPRSTPLPQNPQVIEGSNVCTNQPSIPPPSVSPPHSSDSPNPTPNNGTSQHQQFCLRWHNHQTSLLSTLPQLLDQSHLTDVTLVADGRKLRAHRLVLSGCSTFFSEIFHTLESSSQQCHPVIVLPPNTNFSSLAALVTFMYSGEVNVYEDQIPTLLALADILGIKGLTDINGENGTHKSHGDSPGSSETGTPPVSAGKMNCFSPPPAKDTSPSHTPSFAHPSNKLLSPSSFDAFFPRPPGPFNFYPHHLLTQPINFSTNRSTFLPGTHSHGMMPPIGSQSPIPQPNPPQSPSFGRSGQNNNNCNNNNNNNNNSVEANRNYLDKMAQDANKKPKLISNAKKIDKIAENLRYSTSTPESPTSASATKSFLEHFSQLAQKSPQLLLAPPTSQSNFPLSPSLASSAAAFQSFLSADNKIKQPTMDNLMMRSNDQMSSMSYQDQNKKPPASTTATGAPTKIPNSKLFAKCFICSKLLSNQYNLRVHLETHQNMRYACTVCSHVSRSKDALRKHISYRHPGTPTTCDSDSRRKRTKLASQIQQMQAQQMLKNQIASGVFSTPSSVSSSLSSIPSAVAQEQTASVNQLTLLQSFTSELTIPSMHQQPQSQNQKVPQSPPTNNQMSLQQIKTEINNNNNNNDDVTSHMDTNNDK